MLKNSPGTSEHDAPKSKEDLEIRKEEICKLSKCLIFGSLDDAKCRLHRQKDKEFTEVCSDCELIKERVKMFNTHGCTFSCKKKKRTLVIGENEGHGRLDGKISRESILSILCRYNFPHNPIDENLFLLGIPKDLPEEKLAQRKKDYKKISKYLIRQTYSENTDCEARAKLEKMSFNEFLVDVGMLKEDKPFDRCSEQEIKEARQRYLDALSVSIRGTGAVFIRREPKDIFTNNLIQT